jgi:hypothetical protein
MPTHAEPVACCGPLAVEPLNSWDWYGRGQPVTLSRTPSKMVAGHRNSASRPTRCLPLGFTADEIGAEAEQSCVSA